jgi:hypothetical protein
MGTAGQSATGTALAISGGAGKAPKHRLMRFYGPINDKPPSGGRRGLDVAIGLPYAEFAHRRKGIVNLGCTLVNTSYASAILDGETTRRIGLNLDRGSQPLGTRRIVGKREWQPRGRTSVKSCRQRMAPTVINSARSSVGAFRLRRADSPTVIRGKA